MQTLVLDHGLDPTIANADHYSIVHTLCTNVCDHFHERCARFIERLVELVPDKAELDVMLTASAPHMIRFNGGVASMQQCSPLHIALHRQSYPLCRALLVARSQLAQQPTTDQLTAPLHMAYNEPMARLLLDHGGCVNVCDAYGDTPLLNAVRNDRYAVMDLLLAAGADPNIRNNEGETVLLYSINGTETRMLSTLVQFKADVTATDDNGTTPVMEACRYGFTKALKFLLRQRDALIALDARDTDNGYTALSHACYRGHAGCIRRLIRAGASPLVTDHAGATPLSLLSDKMLVATDSHLAAIFLELKHYHEAHVASLTDAQSDAESAAVPPKQAAIEVIELLDD
jgi:Ankyrin repeats (3 copies)/Ankyrin repeats (many copies)/Ankyrin repeat